jgi:hypothetical protein
LPTKDGKPLFFLPWCPIFSIYVGQNISLWCSNQRPRWPTKP